MNTHRTVPKPTRPAAKKKRTNGGVQIVLNKELNKQFSKRRFLQEKNSGRFLQEKNSGRFLQETRDSQCLLVI
jgi:hypothetical protein